MFFSTNNEFKNFSFQNLSNCVNKLFKLSPFNCRLLVLIKKSCVN